MAGIIDGDLLKELFAILQKSPSVIRGYPSRLCDVAGVLYGLGQKIPPVLGVICTGENLFDFQRQILGEVFNASVIEEYGCQETGIWGMTCPEAGRLHLDSGTPLDSRKTNRCLYEIINGELVTTDLFNYVMPLVRYKCGDILELESKPCSCGLGCLLCV